MKQNLFNKLWLRVGMIVAIMTTALSGTAWAESYNVTYNYSDLGEMLSGSHLDASSYWKVPETAGNSATINIPITNQPTSDVTITFRIATFGQGTNPSSSNTTITAVGTETGSSWTGSGVSSYPSSSTYVNGVMTITKPSNPTTLGGLNITMGVNSGVKIFRLQSVTVSYTYGGTPTPTTYTVTYDCNGATSGCPNDVTDITAGTSITLASAPTKTNYTFDGWSDGTNTYQAGGSYTVNGDVTMTAQWTANGGGSGETITFDFEDDTAHRTSGSNSYSSNTYSENGVNISLTYADAVTSGSPLNGSANVMGRIAKNTTNSPVVLIGPIDISSKIITSIAYKTKGVSAMSQVLEYSLNNIDWTTLLSLAEMPTQATTETAANLSITGTNLYLRWTTSVSASTNSARDFQLDDVVITYTNDGTPSISASDVNIGYDAESGTITYTLENEVIGGALTAAITAGNTGNWLSVDNPSNSNASGTVALTCSANTGEARTATVTLTYTYNTNESVMKEVTVTQAAAPVIYTTISDLFAAATSAGSTATNVNVTFGNWVVSGVSGSNAFVTDNNGNGFIIYKSDHGFSVNDKLSGTVSETPLKLYNGSAEFTNLTASTSGLTVTNDGEITVITNKTIADLGGVNTGAVITLSNLTYDETNLSDGTNTIKPYNTLYSGMSFTSGKTYNVTGVYQQYNSTKEILPRSAADIEEVVSAEPSITLASYSVEATATTDLSGTIEVTYDNITTVASDIAFYESDGTTSATYNWIRVTINSSDNVEYSIDANNGAARTAYFKVWAYDDNMNEVYSNLVTVTQAAYVPAPASDNYIRISSLDKLTDGSIVVIAARHNTTTNSYYAMANTTSGKPTGALFTSTTLNGNEILPSSIVNDEDDYYWVVTVTSDGYEFTNADGNKIGYGTSGTNFVNGGTNTTWKIESGTSESSAMVEGYNGFVIKNENTNTRAFAFNGSVFGAYATTNMNTSDYNFHLDFFVQMPTESVSVTAAGYATYCSENALDFTGTAITAYVGTINGTALTFTPITQVPANTGLLLVAEGGATVDVPVIASADPVQNNCLTGVNEATTLNENDYILNVVGGKAGFYKAGEYKALAAHRAYISATAGGQVKSFYIDLEDDPTGISLMEDGRSQMEDGVIYNLAGQRISKMQKGINIVNGKKILK